MFMSVRLCVSVSVCLCVLVISAVRMVPVTCFSTHKAVSVPKAQTMHPKHYAQEPTLYTLHPTPLTLNPEPSSPTPKAQIPKLAPQTPPYSPKKNQSLKPKPSIVGSFSGTFSEASLAARARALLPLPRDGGRVRRPRPLRRLTHTLKGWLTSRTSCLIHRCDRLIHGNG